MLNCGKFAGIWSGRYRGDTSWDILSDTTWTVPVTGYYQIDLRGGGGGGGKAFYRTYNGSGRTKSGGPGGNSRQSETHFLKKGDTYAITIGEGGAASTGNDGGKGGTSSFGSLITISGGEGGTDGFINGYGQTSGGTTGASYGNATPGSGDPGDGGSGGYMTYYNAWYTYAPGAGEDGACYINYLGQGYARN